MRVLPENLRDFALRLDESRGVVFGRRMMRLKRGRKADGANERRDELAPPTRWFGFMSVLPMPAARASVSAQFNADEKVA